MILISGMHRSGTSLVAKLFHAAGADMGDSAEFYAADQWNSTGYYEQRAIIALNLKLLHGPWGRLAYLHLPCTKTVLRRARPCADEIARLGEMYASKVVKENRFCLTLPAWRTYGGKVHKVIVCLREPANVVQSLWRRNKIPLWYGYRLWYKHITRLLEYSAGLDLWFVRYEHLIDPTTNQAELLEALRFTGLNCTTEDIQSCLASAVKANIKNRVSPCQKIYPDYVRNLWCELSQRHVSQASS